MRQSIQDIKQYIANIITPQSRIETIAWIPTEFDSDNRCDFDWKGYAAGFANASDHNRNPLWQLRNTSPSTRFAGGHGSYRSFNVDKNVMLTHKFEPKRSRGIRGLCIVAVAIEPALDGNDELDHWYRDEHLELLTKVPVYLRTSRYTLLRPSGSPAQHLPPSHLALHEYISSKELLKYALQHGPLAPETERSKRIFGGAKHVERTVWNVAAP
ncbi:hypothetical protein LTR95_017069 [Oleoguttula sp. CCFEE 5521]